MKYHTHKNNFQTSFRHKVFHNLEPNALIKVQNTMTQITVREALSRLKFVTNNRLLTGIERTRDGGTLLLFNAGLTTQVEESTSNITHTLEEIPGIQLITDIKETLGLG